MIMKIENKKYILSYFIVIIFFTFFITTFAYADDIVQLEKPIQDTDLIVIIGLIIQAILGVTGSLSLLMFVYGGFLWMTSAGNKNRVQKGKEVLIWATIGLTVIFSSYAMIKLIFHGLGVM